MKLSIKSASSGFSNHKFNPTTITSLDFGRLVPVRLIETLPKDDFTKIKGMGFMRIAPQNFPPFGRAFLKSAAFFVPDYQLFQDSTAFHVNQNSFKGQPVILPSFPNTFINQYFASSSLLSNLVSTSSAPATPYTFTTIKLDATRTVANGNGLHYFTLTRLGKDIFSIIKALGYDFVANPVVPNETIINHSVHTSYVKETLSAIPFLAYLKVYADMFLSSVTYNNADITAFLQAVYNKKDFVLSGDTLYTASTGIIEVAAFKFFETCNLAFESNMYTTAWNTVGSPTGVFNDINQINNSSLLGPVGRTDYGEFRSLNVSSFGAQHDSSSMYSALGHRTLIAFDKFVRRRGLLGSKSVQQIYGLFGVKSDDFNSNFVTKLYESSEPLVFNAVVSNSDTEVTSGGNTTGKKLGAFAGYAQAPLNFEFSYKCRDYGTIIILTWLNIDPIISRGNHPSVLRSNPLDFYTPDWDGKAYRPIPHMELVGGNKTYIAGTNPRKIFGYTNMYDDYRTMRDNVQGDFVTDEIANQFFFGRNFNPLLINNEGPQDNKIKYFNNLGNVAYEYSGLTNPFQTAHALGDRFWLGINFDISATRPILSSDDSLDIGGAGDTVVTKNGDMMA